MGGGIGRRIGDLERRASKPTETGRSEVFLHLKTILDELAYLKQSCAPGLRGGVPIEPENIPQKVLGPDYTHRQLLELAISRSVESGRVPAERSQANLEYMCEMGREDLSE